MFFTCSVKSFISSSSLDNLSRIFCVVLSLHQPSTLDGLWSFFFRVIPSVYDFGCVFILVHIYEGIYGLRMLAQGSHAPLSLMLLNIIAFLVGAIGAFAKRIPASSGVRFAFLRLQGLQADTILFQECPPPRDRGITWSMEAFLGFRWQPQYWQQFPSRRYTFRLEGDLERTKGTRTYSRKIITEGNSK